MKSPKYKFHHTIPETRVDKFGFTYRRIRFVRDGSNEVYSDWVSDLVDDESVDECASRHGFRRILTVLAEPL